MNVAEGQMIPTYQADGNVSTLPYTFSRLTTRASETTENDGLGNPINGGTGLIRSFFRPSDDATIFQFLVPSNMMFATFLEPCSEIMAQISGQEALAKRMSSLSKSLRHSIESHAVSHSKKYGSFYPYEVDGYMVRDTSIFTPVTIADALLP